jgi:hypothetical protein
MQMRGSPWLSSALLFLFGHALFVGTAIAVAILAGSLD